MKIAILRFAAAVVVMLIGGCAVSNPEGTTIPAQMTIGDGPLLPALEAAKGADEAARQALDALNACQTDSSCGEDERRSRRDTLARTRAVCVEMRDEYLATVGENLDDSSVALYPKVLDESFINTRTKQPFTCGR